MTFHDELDHFLADMEYPATKDDLLREAIRFGLDWADLNRLGALSYHGYDSGWQVRHQLQAATTASQLDHERLIST